jgi:hypothetical protein
MAGKHNSILIDAMILLSKDGVRVFRNKVGSGWTGQVLEQYQASGGGLCVELKNASFQPFGLLVPSSDRWSGNGNEKTKKPLSQTRVKKHGGSSDLIGWRPLKITMSMVGQTIAQFVAGEVKTDEYNTLDTDQKIFLANVVKAGGLALIIERDGKDGVIFTEVTSE